MRALVPSLLSLAGAAPAVAQEPSAADVGDALDRSVDWLVSQQRLDGGWAYDGRRVGATALVLYTLLRSGTDPRHQAVQRALAHLEGRDRQQTYDTAILILALGAHDPVAHRERITELADRLLEWQHGDWGYPGGADLSNTQYAALGLWAASRAGVSIPPRAWVELAKATMDYQNRDGGFSYQPDGASTGSMTAAGVGVLAICRDRLGKDAARSHDRSVSRLDRTIDDGLEWLDEHYSVVENPGRGERHLGYYLYGLERLGALVPTRTIGEHDWYADGAAALAERQGEAGHWGGFLGGNPVQTCFGTLFLRRATHPVTGGVARGERRYDQRDVEASVQIAAGGDNPLGMWITAFSREALEAYEWKGERGLGPRVERVLWRVDGAVVGRVPGDPDEPAGTERFPHRVGFDEPGSHRVEAEVHLLAPPARTESGRILPPALKILRSEALEVAIANACPEWMLDNARDAWRNLLPGQGVEARASSALSGREPRQAVDGDQETAWLAAGDDPRPTLTLELAEPVEANTIVVGHAREWPIRPGRWARALEVEIAVNGGGARRARMHSDERRKSRLRLPFPVQVRTVEIAIPVRVPGEEDERAVGLAEVELQRSE